MSDKPSPHIELLLLCGKVRDNALTAKDAARLDALLQASDQAKTLFVQYMSIASLLESRGTSERKTGQASDELIDASPTINHDVLAELLELERQAEPIEVVLKPQPKTPKADQLSWSEVASAAAYLLNRPKVWGSLAAVLAIALILSVVVSSINSPSPIADNANPTSPTPPTATQRQPVATLTNTQNAQWSPPQAEGASAPGSPLSVGSPLHAGTRLTLTAGFAEITTNRGAVAILEAPCVVELKDNDNGLRLVTGKLVGICETESSKGFLVRTPHMDVTDLGTRFGVDASQPDATEVHVFEGEVRVDRPATGSTPAQRQALTQGQAVRASAIVDATSDRLVSIPPAPDRFTLNLEKRLIAASGRGQVSGEIDPNWHVVAVDGQPVTENGEMTAWSDPKETVAREASKWIRVNNALNPPGKKRAVFTCRSTFELAEELDTAATELCLRLRADHTLAALRINGQDLDVPKNRVGIGPEWLTWTLTEYFVPGKNTIELDIEEIISLKQEGSSGLRAEVEARRR